MTEWTYSKGQVSEGAMTAFGIEICTRHNKANELVEMINFCKLAAESGLEKQVTRLFYDSNSCSCTIELKSSVEPFSVMDQALLEIARETIGQFDWNGIVEHGAPLD